MRFILFQTRHPEGVRRWAVSSSAVVEVLPMIAYRPVTEGPVGALGLFDHHGALTPLIDLSLRLGGEATEPTLGSRVLVLRHGEGVGGFLVDRILGLEAIAFDAEGAHAGLDVEGEGPGGRVARREGGIVQELRIDRLVDRGLARILEGGRT